MFTFVSGSCECYEGYSVGPTTQVCDTHTPAAGTCQGTSCHNGGTCSEVTNLLTGVLEAVCVCVSGWMGQSCDTGLHCSCVIFDIHVIVSEHSTPFMQNAKNTSSLYLRS